MTNDGRDEWRTWLPICISFAAFVLSIVGLWDTHRQYLSSMRPLVDFDSETDPDSLPVGIALTNSGPGPALIKSLTFYVDRKSVKDAGEALDYGKITDDDLFTFEFDPDDTLAAGSKEWLLEYRKP